MSELEGQGREYGAEVAPPVEIARTEKTRAEFPIREAHLRKCLGDGRLPRPRKTVEPEHTLVLLVLQPVFELEEDVSPGPLHTPLPVPTEIPRVRGMRHSVEKSEVRSVLFTGLLQVVGQRGEWELTMS